MENKEAPLGMKWKEVKVTSVTHELVPDNVYGDWPAEVLKKYAPGRQMLDFRPPKSGEEYLDKQSSQGGQAYSSITTVDKCRMDFEKIDYSGDIRRIILKPKLKKRVLVGEWEIVDSAFHPLGKIAEKDAEWLMIESTGLNTYHIEEREV